jgi:hypothetical protein
MKDYRETILEGESLLEQVTARKWEHGNTGGGCDAFFLNLNDEKHSYFMVTVAGDASIPENDAEWQSICLGRYDIENDCGDIVESVSTIGELGAFFSKAVK